MKTVHVTLELTEKCNQDCHYCLWHNNSTEFSKLDLVNSIIENLYLLDNKYTFYLFGGEPTIHPNFREIIKKIYSKKEKVKDIFIQTNLARSKDWFKNTITLFPELRFLCSYHNHQNNNFEEYLDKLVILNSLSTKLISCDFMLEYDNPDEILEKYTRMKSSGIRINLNEIFYNKPSENLLKEIVYSKKYSHLLRDTHSTDQETNWNGYNCMAGIESFFIGTKGDVYYCSQHRFLNKERPIGNIIRDFGKVRDALSRPAICRWKTCRNIPDARLRKWKNQN